VAARSAHLAPVCDIPEALRRGERNVSCELCVGEIVGTLKVRVEGVKVTGGSEKM